MITKKLKASTLGLHAAIHRTGELEHSQAIFQTSSFIFRSAEDAAAVFAGKKSGNIYSRFTNPTVQAFERRLAILEGGESCIATASGMAAILTTCLVLLKQGDHLLASRTLFGTTISLFNTVLTKFGVEVSYADPCDLADWRAKLRPNTRLLFLETPTNPLGEIADIAGLAKIARGADAKLAVDNCFLTSALQKPMELGADLVVHSATKYLDGQGRCIGGAIVSDRKIGEQLFGFMRSGGPSMSPFNAWVFLKGLETMSLRMKAHCAHAQQVAEWLAKHPRVKRVYYAGLKSHPQHRLAKRQARGFGGIVSFELKGGQAAAFRLINRVELFSITANLGDARSTITHPSTTTHNRMGAEARKVAGIGDGLVRLSVGLEDPGDLIADLKQALG